MDVFDFLGHCRAAWLMKEQIARRIAKQEKITIPELSALYYINELTVSIAVAYLAWRREISVVGLNNEGRILSAQYSSPKHLEDAAAEKKRILKLVRAALPETEFNIPGLAFQLKENEYAVLEAIDSLCNSGEVSDTGRSVQASDGSNLFYQIYVKTKPD